MRLAFFTDSYHPIVSGVVVSVEAFTTQLRRRGHQVRIFTPRFPGYQDEDPDVVRLPSLSLPTNPRYPLGLPFSRRADRAVAAWGAQVVHVHAPFLLGRVGAGIARHQGLPLVFTMHTRYEHYAHYIPLLPHSLTARLAAAISRRFANSCDCVIAPSPGFAEQLRLDGITARIEPISTGLDLSALPTPDPKEREHWGVPPQAPLLLGVGRLAPEKNVALTLQAFSRLQTPGVHLLLVGGGPYQRRAEQLARELGVVARVHFAGYLPRSRVFSCAAAAYLFLFPSLTDTQGIVVLEAMSQGLPCVCTQSPAIAGVVQEGENGLIVKEEAGAFAQAIDRLLADAPARAAMAAQARQTAAGYDLGHCTDRLLEIYRELLSQRPQGERQ